jgi:hypothetical protein
MISRRIRPATQTSQPAKSIVDRAAAVAKDGGKNLSPELIRFVAFHIEFNSISFYRNTSSVTRSVCVKGRHVDVS